MEQKSENEKKKEYLWKYRNALKKEKTLEEEINQLRLDKMMPCVVQDGMPHGSGCGDLSGYVAKLDELMDELKNQMELRIGLRMEISRKIEEVPDETESLLLRYRYIYGLKWEDISVKMGYTYHHVLKIHGKALRNFKMDTQ